MKKLALIVLLFVVCLAAPAWADDAPADMRPGEVPAMMQAALLHVLEAGDMPVMAANDDYESAASAYACELGVFDIAGEQFQPDCDILRVNIITPEYVDVRGVSVGSYVSDILGRYPNENGKLYGTNDQALLFLRQNEGDVLTYGMVYRDGQRLSSIQYAVVFPDSDGYREEGVTYNLTGGYVSSWTMYRAEERMSVSAKDALFAECAQLRTKTTVYSLIPYDGTAVEALSREDLVFGQMDFLYVTPAEAQAVYGQPADSMYMSSADGTYLYMLQWEDLSLIFQTDAQKQVIGVSQAHVIGEALPGPRGVRVGDYLEDVLMRFPRGDGMRKDGVEKLYGFEDTLSVAPYGKVVYYDNEQMVYYACEIEWEGRHENQCVVLFYFVDGQLADYTVYCVNGGDIG